MTHFCANWLAASTWMKRVCFPDPRRSPFRSAGHDVREAHDGPPALEAALEYKPDVVLLDIGLPGMNGFEVAKRLRQQPELGNVVLVAMTGYGQESDRRRSLEAGFDHHLVKPADFAKVRNILATIKPRVS